jgi:hypothetical protein
VNTTALEYAMCIPIPCYPYSTRNSSGCMYAPPKIPKSQTGKAITVPYQT